MESNTLSNIHIATSIEQFSKKGDIEPSIFFSYIIDISSEKKVDEVFHQLFKDKEPVFFSVTLVGNEKSSNITDSWLEKFCLILSHPLYTKIDGNLVVYITGLLSNNEVAFTTLLGKELKKQGFANFLFARTNDLIGPTLYFYDKNVSGLNFYEWYISKLITSPSRLNIFTFWENLQSFDELLRVRIDAEEKLSLENPIAYRLIKEFQKRSEEGIEKDTIINELKENLFSKKNYLDFILGKFNNEEDNSDINFNEILKIKKFYQQEYEILPAWYKRLGHVIKVITGKRTFRSLFNDNVKKYKD